MSERRHPNIVNLSEIEPEDNAKGNRFGYRTRYAHMHEFSVRPGQNVKRGDLIGYVGNSGLSTAPHLHYEVLIKGGQVNPVHYFYNDLSPAEYEKVLELASIENQSLGM